MENQVNDAQPINAKGLILLIGSVFGALTAFASCGSFSSIIGGLIGGLIFAIFFNSVLLPQKPHDR
ncbi:hypothetical protein [Sphingobacterium faecale]|uniref:Lipoprotein n=1 Tax=Sphingobacterium faecale TaxID=2803775 RepID=A0ABS1R4C2_9SPHI|nr:hypothetical protein [Sphingobacterium faecale]MBL1409558.1 hypothetical protein [Sphingobacterium faecale]